MNNRMRVYKDGVFRKIERQEYGYYLKRGYKKAGCIEPQPSQLGLYVIDDYTIGKKDTVKI